MERYIRAQGDADIHSWSPAHLKQRPSQHGAEGLLPRLLGRLAGQGLNGDLEQHQQQLLPVDTDRQTDTTSQGLNGDLEQHQQQLLPVDEQRQEYTSDPAYISTGGDLVLEVYQYWRYLSTEGVSALTLLVEVYQYWR